MADNPENTRGPPQQPNTKGNQAASTSTPDSNPAPSASARHETPSPSLASRVQSSAAGLAKSAFQNAGPGSGASQTLAGLTDGKAGASSAQGGSLASRDLGGSLGTSSGSGAGGQREVGGEAFREARRENAGGVEVPSMTEEEFLRAGPGEIGAGIGMQGAEASAEGIQGEVGNWKGKQRAYDPVQLDYNSAWERVNTGERTQEPQLLASDGEAVVSLLSDASFDPSFDADIEAAGLDLDPGAAPPPLTKEEIDMLESFRREVQSEDGVRAQISEPAQLSSLSLVPDIDAFLQQNDPSGYAQMNSTGATSLRDNVLANLPGAEDWVDVHERYHDEVWGYLQPALEAAKNELDEKADQGTDGDEDGPAVRRLKQILRHMKV